MRHPLRATISGVLAALALSRVGVPAEGGVLVGLALGWLYAAAAPGPHERALTRTTTCDYLLFERDRASRA